MSQELKKEWREQLEDLIAKYKTDISDGGYFDLVDGYIPLESFISSLLAKQQAEFDKTLNSGRKMYELGKAETLSQIKGIGCEEGIDIVTVAKIINRLNEKS